MMQDALAVVQRANAAGPMPDYPAAKRTHVHAPPGAAALCQGRVSAEDRQPLGSGYVAAYD
jgi:hypothetical protein